ncbi:MAG: hypothetical protein ACREIV_06360, partial [Planctomycetaceae bacterium]
MTTVHVRREYPVEGRVLLPEGVDAHGLLVTGFGFGPGNTGDIPRARTRKDGSFRMLVPAGHGYVLGVSDLQWSSDIWAGAILPIEGEPQREIVLKGYPATPVEFLVTRGSTAEPIPDAWVNLSRRGEVDWTDETGESRSGHAGIGGRLRTDENGRASTGVGRGEIEVRISSGDWDEKKTIQVTSSAPVRINFHRPWIGNRIVTARPIADAADYVPSAEAVALAWTERSEVGDTIHEPIITQSGAVEVEFDEKKVSLLLLDHKQHVSGFARAGVDDAAVDLSMQPNATYRGTLVDRQDEKPLADLTVRMITDSSYLDVVEPQQTDSMGRFEFTDVPAGVPLRLSIRNERGQPEYHLFGGDRLFEPGEHRTGDVAKAALMNGNVAVSDKRPEQTIAQRIANAAENSRVMGMRTLVVIEGDDDSIRVKHVAGRLCNADEVEAVLRYLPVIVTAQQQTAEADALAARNWPRPEAGEIVLVVSADGKDALASLRLNYSDIEAAVQQGTEFLEQHVPETHDGRKKLEEARREAGSSNRTVWVIAGGPRCGPCFRLARWIDEHHDV